MKSTRILYLKLGYLNPSMHNNGTVTAQLQKNISSLLLPRTSSTNLKISSVQKSRLLVNQGSTACTSNRYLIDAFGDQERLLRSSISPYFRCFNSNSRIIGKDGGLNDTGKRFYSSKSNGKKWNFNDNNSSMKEKKNEQNDDNTTTSLNGGSTSVKNGSAFKNGVYSGSSSRLTNNNELKLSKDNDKNNINSSEPIIVENGSISTSQNVGDTEERTSSGDSLNNNFSSSSSSSKNTASAKKGNHLGKRLSIILGYIATKAQQLKFFLIKSKRPFNTDDFSAFISWLLAGNIALMFIGTTTFFSLVLFTLNTVVAQELVAEKVGNFITKNSKLTVTFENAIVPTWKEGKIQFKNCFVSRRPRNQQFFKKKSDDTKLDEISTTEFDDGNYTQFDLTIEEVSISLSFGKWLSGKGIIKECSIKGMRGVVDRTHVYWLPGDKATNYKNVSQPGDWEIENLKMEDILFTMMNPNGFKTFKVSIYNAEVPLFRKNWLMFDMLNSKHVSGSYDGSLFTINKLQRVDDFKEELKINNEVKLINEDNPNSDLSFQTLLQDQNFDKVTRCRIDNLKIEHLNGGMEGPFGWINKGTVDMIGDIIIPKKNLSYSKDDISLNEIIKYYKSQHKQEVLVESDDGELKLNSDNLFIMDFYLRLNNPKATIPLFTNELSYINSALVRPIVGYINSRKTFIPIRCRVIKDLRDFDGSWTVYDSLLMDDLSLGVYNSFAEYVSDEQYMNARVKKVVFWSLQFLIQFVLWSLSTLG